LDDVISTSLFRPFAFGGVENNGISLTLPASSFPLLSQGDHPTLGTPCWYLHPCETASAVRELLEEEPLNVIEKWMLIVGNVVQLGT
jgi:ubiquitin-like-conjugating enzyme ATG10